MTLGQFSLAVGASPRWVQNARAALPLGAGYTVGNARRLALARTLQRTCGMPLVEAYGVAREALAAWPASRRWERTACDGVTIAVDLERFLGAFAARLSLSRTLYAERERGRPRRVRRRGLALARHHGVDVGLLEASLARTPAERLQSLDRDVEFLRSLRPARAPAPRIRRSRPRKSPPMSLIGMLAGLTRAGVRFVVIGGLAGRVHGSARITEDLDVCYATAPDNRARLARQLAAWKAYPRGIEPGLPFIMDDKTLSSTPILTLVTDQGFLDVFDRVPGVGGYDEALVSSIEVDAGNVTFSALDLPALIRSKRAAGRPRDLDQIPELEALLELGRRRP